MQVAAVSSNRCFASAHLVGDAFLGKLPASLPARSPAVFNSSAFVLPGDSSALRDMAISRGCNSKKDCLEDALASVSTIL